MPTNGRTWGARADSALKAGSDAPGTLARRGWARGEVADRECLVADIRSAILDGTYHRDALTIADRLLDRVPNLGSAEL